jgi:hypothetical protein
MRRITSVSLVIFSALAASACVASTDDDSESVGSLDQALTTDLIIDNGGAGYSEVGTWSSSANAGYYGTNSKVVTSGSGSRTATWTPTIVDAGSYDVYAWWVAASNRTSVTYTVSHAAGTTNVVRDQTLTGSQWVLLGTYNFNLGAAGSVRLSDAGTAGKYVSADAVKFTYRGPTDTIVDNTSAGFAASTSWIASSSTSGYYGSNYHYRMTGAADPATYTTALPVTGAYRVHARWTSGTNRSASAPFTVSHQYGSTTVYANQTINNGAWVRLGTFDLAAASALRVSLGANTSGTVVVADAVRFEPVTPWAGWTDATGGYSGLPSAIKVYRKTDGAPVRFTAIDIDMNSSAIKLQPFVSSSRQTVPSWENNTGAYVAINAGYFDFSNGASYSAIANNTSLLSKNTASVTRSGVSYPITRGLFSQTGSGFSVDWVYHFGPGMADTYRYGSPNPNASGSPASAPVQSNGIAMSSSWTGVGAGPVLVKSGIKVDSWEAEGFFGSGIERDVRDPRSAVCYTPSRHVVFLTADGRQPGVSIGMTLPAMADLMLEMGCIEALNLDGGGSTGIAIGGSYVNSPSETRAVSSVLAVLPQ